IVYVACPRTLVVWADGSFLIFRSTTGMTFVTAVAVLLARSGSCSVATTFAVFFTCGVSNAMKCSVTACGPILPSGAFPIVPQVIVFVAGSGLLTLAAGAQVRIADMGVK